MCVTREDIHIPLGSQVFYNSENDSYENGNFKPRMPSTDAHWVEGCLGSCWNLSNDSSLRLLFNSNGHFLFTIYYAIMMVGNLYVFSHWLLITVPYGKCCPIFLEVTVTFPGSDRDGSQNGIFLIQMGAFPSIEWPFGKEGINDDTNAHALHSIIHIGSLSQRCASYPVLSSEIPKML